MDTININVENTKSTKLDKPSKLDKLDYESTKWLTGC